MTTATRSVAVVATRLPDVDRRALSQAWYSALHLAQTPPGATRAMHPRAATSSPAAPGRSSSVTSGVHRQATATAPTRSPRSTTTAGASGSAERRAAQTDLTRRIERALTRHQSGHRMRPATLTVKTLDGRVQLIVRTDATATRVVAICAPELRERVDRALARARFTLAAAGTPIHAEPA